MQRIPLIAGSGVTVVNAADDAIVLRPPPPSERPIADVGAAVRDALRFPLAGPRLEALVPRQGGRATIVVEPPSLPLPSSPHDPRQLAIAATVDELERAGIASGYQTILVAGGFGRRSGRAELEDLVTPDFARRFHGLVVVHDVEAEDLVQIGQAGQIPLRVNPTLLDADVVVVVTAAETVLHGGPGALLGACGREAIRAATSYSLLETSASQGWRLAVALERALAERVALVGVSLTLDHPRFGGAVRGYPYEAAALERIARSPLRRAFALTPRPVRNRILHALPCEIGVTAAFSGPPSVAHAEALLRAIAARETLLDEPLDAILIGIPQTTPILPRERPNPLLAATIGLGLALRLWRERFPLKEDGTAILLHGFERHFAHPTQQPYRAFFQATRLGRDPELLAEHERLAGQDERAIQLYREGRSCHPLLPFAHWESCQPALQRLGAVVVAGCRDATAARQLGFVPSRSVGAALQMAYGRAGGDARIGFLVAPPDFPLALSAPEP
ncbi:MAG: lactate racemase [Gaiellaceae bacterium]|nr:lactate racemase [Gaiellaceae bacterium]